MDPVRDERLRDRRARRHGTASYDDEGHWVTVTRVVGCVIRVVAGRRFADAHPRSTWTARPTDYLTTMNASWSRASTRRDREADHGGAVLSSLLLIAAAAACGGELGGLVRADAGVGCLPGRCRGDVPVPT